MIPDYSGDHWFFHGPGNIDNFVVVFNATITNQGFDNILIHTISDDGVRVYIDGDLYHSDWSLHAPREKKTRTVLPPGKHELTVVYFEHGGTARLELSLLLEETMLEYYPTGISRVFIEGYLQRISGYKVYVTGIDGKLYGVSRVPSSNFPVIRLREPVEIPICLTITSS